jgi:hypothetical protein
MTNMADCIARGIDFGEIDRARGIAAQGQFTQLVERYSTIMDLPQAQARAAKDLKEATAKMKTQRFHKVVNQLQAMKRIQDLVGGARDPAAAVRNLLEHSEGSGFTGESVKSLTEAYEASIRAGLSDALQAVGLNVVGSSRNKPLLLDLIKELHNEATGNAQAKALAGSVRKQQQRMRRAFNAHGGDIGNLSDFGVTHSHDGAVIRQAGFDTWAGDVEAKLAWDRIVDHNTGQPFASAPGQVPPRSASARFLSEVYEGITTNGWDNREPAMSMGGRALYNQRAEHRVLHFKDGSAWLEYNAKYGTADPFSAMMNGLNGMARDVALMRVLGPNPNAGLEFAAQVARKQAETLGDPKLVARVETQSKVARVMLAHANGAANVPERIATARFFAGTRAVLSSVQLGSAVLSSVSDMATIMGAAQHLGMNTRNVLGRSVSLMAKHATRETAARMGYVAATLADAGGGSARYFGQMFGTGIPERLAGFTLRATGLTFVTDMRKIAFQMEFSGFLAENAARDFAAIDKPLRDLFEARGITARDWDLLRDPATQFVEPGGANFISPLWWLEHQTALPRVEAEGLALRLQMAIQEQLEFAIPTANLEGRAMLQGQTAPGSFGGELLRSSASYKSFAMSLMLGQFRRYAALPTPWDKAKYATKMSLMMFAMGALAVQLKELAKGNDPRPMNEGKFVMAALFQGGGLGIFGDFFASETSRVGGGIGATLAGPVAGAIGDAIGPVASNVTRAVNGQETLIGRDVANTVQRYTPFLSSAWYARTAYSRLVVDELASFLDPEADLIQRRRLKRLASDYGTQPFIPPRGSGDSLRAPDLSNAWRSQ